MKLKSLESLGRFVSVLCTDLKGEDHKNENEAMKADAWESGSLKSFYSFCFGLNNKYENAKS